MRAIRPLNALLAALAVWVLSSDMSAATPLNQWKISCGVDRGAITHSRDRWVFRTSSNKCPGGIFNQRAEISSEKISPNHAGTYRFQTRVSIRSPNNNRFGLFQIHDGRFGCAPPLKLDVLETGQLALDSEYKIGTEPGLNCRRNRALNSNVSSATIRRDGTEYLLEVVVDFDGQGSFRIWVSLDGRPQMHGRYEYIEGRGFFRSSFFYFKHGVYSRYPFPYELTSRNMTVRRVRLAN